MEWIVPLLLSSLLLSSIPDLPLEREIEASQRGSLLKWAQRHNGLSIQNSRLFYWKSTVVYCNTRRYPIVTAQTNLWSFTCSSNISLANLCPYIMLHLGGSLYFSILSMLFKTEYLLWLFSFLSGNISVASVIYWLIPFLLCLQERYENEIMIHEVKIESTSCFLSCLIFLICRYPTIDCPHSLDIHESPVTAVSYYSDCPSDLMGALTLVGCKQRKKGLSDRVSTVGERCTVGEGELSISLQKWPINGGIGRDCATGHQVREKD